VARVITELGRIGTARSGRGTDGSIKNNKVVVWGKIAISSYTTGGELVAPKDIGLAAIDYIQTDVRFAGAAGTTETATGAFLGAGYIGTSNKLMLTSDVDGGAETTSTHIATVFYLASGDATVADLT